jgi:hypothetical protein
MKRYMRLAKVRERFCAKPTFGCQMSLDIAIDSA